MPSHLLAACQPVRRAGLAVLAAVLGLASASAQTLPEREVRIDRLGVEDGLAQSIVTSLVQDRHGFLWIGTEGGLDRFDGYQFVPFRHDPGDPGSLSSSFVNALAETPDGALWVGTHGAGLNRLDPQTGIARRLRHAEGDRQSLSADRVMALFVDREGRLWAGTEAGLDRVDLQTARVTRMLEATEVVDVAQAPGGDLWLATHEGLIRFAPTTGHILARWGAAELGSEQATAVWADDDGILWVGTASAGLVRLDPRTGATERFRPSAEVGGDAIQDVMRDSRGTLWVATMGGLARLDVRPPEVASWTVFLPSETDRGTLPVERTRTLLEDRGGLVWVGTWAGGLAKLRRTPFRRFAADPGRADALSSNDIMGLAEDPREDGVLWVGTYDAGLNRLDLATGAASRAGLPPELRTTGVRSVATDRVGALWATGGSAGVWRRDPDTGAWDLVPFEEGANVEGVLSLAAAPDGAMWVATYGAGPCVAVSGAETFRCPARTWRGERALRSDLAYVLHPDEQGRVWVSLWGSGVDVIDPARGRIVSFENRPDDPASLSDNNVTSFFRDAQGRMWLTTYGGGLNRLLSPSDGGTFAHLTQRDGLPHGTTYGILPQTDSTLWISTNGGLARYDVASGAMMAYGADDGLPGDEFNGYSYARLRDGRMAFGGIRGLAVFDPGTVGTEAPPPPVAVTALRVLGREVDYPAGPTPRVRLTYRQSAVAFDVAALDFTAPEDNLYAFWLEGMEPDWEPASPRRTAAFTNLAPGSYTLHVRAAGAGGVWNEDALAIPLVVTPAWWQTGWFRLLAGLALLGGVVWGVREASQRRLRAEVRRLETEKRLQAERERISRDLHDHVGGQLSGLIASAELARLQRRRARRSGTDIPDDADALDRIEGDARETMRQLRETVWALHHEAVTLSAFRDRLAADLDSRLRGRDAPAATVALDGDPDHVLSPLQALHLYRVAREAITNSLKHADAATLAVTLRQSDEAVAVEVHDDGTFRPHETGSGDGASGFGMGSMRARAEALGGTFHLDTTAGTTVRVTVPSEPPEA